ncbi:MAG TPA: sugar MFS transporter [Chitinophaga sp.]|uniref:sugar MFS transporter n=1 Tax=Chitinophaga sp. TaxID=1869181 RepID=UPI002DB611D2|nr:sugar MFS transporter [Chitinophaga sp.]HEU4554778.1 sugar MFS transporter [Chitinophaga sp.]
MAITIIGIFFFIFGFISWINGTLIPYLKIACELQEWQAYLVTFAFYISYTIMAMPASRLLQRTGMILGMSAGLYIMAGGCALFIPAALTRSYGLFLSGLFLTGGGLTLLQTAVNPYVTLLGPANSAARRISIMGICNKVAGILAPLIMGSIILKNSGGLTSQLAQMTAMQRKLRLDELAHDVILPYCVLTAILVLVAVLLRFARLPDIKPAAPAAGDTAPATGGARFLPGFTAIFFAVGAEVLAGDTIGNYGLYHGIDLDVAKNFTSYALFCMMVGYVAGVWAIPRYVSQQKAFYASAWLGLILTAAVILLPAKASISCVALLGLANAMLWPAIWPQALKGLEGKALARGSAVLIMGIAGGALMPLLYGWLATAIHNQYAYCILIPAYLFLLGYSHAGIKQAK